MGRMVMMFLCVLLTCMLLAAPYAEAAITCGQVTGALTPCIPYITGGSSGVPPMCCRSIQRLDQEAETTADRQAVCSCIQTAAASISGINFSLAGGLPGACDINVNANITASTNCEQIE